MELMDQQFCSSTGQTLLPPLTSAKKGSTQQPHWATAVVAMAGSAGALLSNGNVQYPQYGLCTGDKKKKFSTILIALGDSLPSEEKLQNS